MMIVNKLDWSDADLPFGGVKNSAFGRELGDIGIQEFVNKKLVRISASEGSSLDRPFDRSAPACLRRVGFESPVPLPRPPPAADLAAKASRRVRLPSRDESVGSGGLQDAGEVGIEKV